MARRPRKAKPDAVAVTHMAYAEAAVMVLECLMHKLIERRIFTAAEMVGMVEDALATKRQMVEEGEHSQVSGVASGVLSTMANSLGAFKASRAARPRRRRARNADKRHLGG